MRSRGPLEGLAEGELRVFFGALALLPEGGAPRRAVPACLSASERERAEAYRHEGARASFVATRSALRELLGAYAGQPAAEVALAVDSMGKPYLEDGGLQFSVSHCEGALALGFSARGAVGVDVEARGRGVEASEGSYGLVLQPAELEHLSRSPERGVEFIRLFTRKEAVLKALGTGFGTDPRAFSVLEDTPMPGLALRTFESGDFFISACRRDAGAGQSAFAFVELGGPSPKNPVQTGDIRASELREDRRCIL